MTKAVIRTDGRAIVLDLSTGARLFGQPVAGRTVAELSALIERAMAEAATDFAFGRWAEPRELYTGDEFAGDGEPRTVHLGVDVFCRPGTPVFAPRDGRVAHAANNDRELDYGPLLILRHDGSGGAFYTLYGHLSLETLAAHREGDPVTAGQQIASVGSPPTNGNWPPHLHFQIINDLLGLGVDFPGVAPSGSREYWCGLSPSPASYFPECDSDLLEYRP